MKGALASLVLLAACAQPGAPPSSAAPAEPQTAAEATAQDTCGASRFLHLVGARADAIDRATLPQRTRIITPDTMVTQDFVPARLNIMVGTDGIVGSINCF